MISVKKKNKNTSERHADRRKKIEKQNAQGDG
jgi:hypothetical protein